ncbi:hypothetical protein ACQPW3_36375 [Actinosynnema sp. CA-248983]
MTATTVPIWHDHTNDIGDWCPFSGEPVTGRDIRCPQGCRASDPDDEQERCRTEDCDGDPDDGAGWDGYCGGCVDQMGGGEDDFTHWC